MKTPDPRRILRLPVLLVAAANLAVGMIGGLVKLPDSPVPLADWNLWAVSYHGPMMVVGFFGTLISLERAVAVDRYWVYVIPWTMAGCGILLLGKGDVRIAAAVATAGGALLGLLTASYAARTRSADLVILAVGAFALAGGCAVWLFRGVYAAVPWWGAFLVLTIAAERRELSKWNRRWAQVGWLFWPAVLAILAGLAAVAASMAVSWRAVGLGWLAVAILLARGDIVGQFLGASDARGFLACSLLLGYVWLAVGGLFWLLSPPTAGFGPLYDRAIHAIFLGFVFSVVFGHAQIVAGAVLGLRIPYTPLHYVPLFLLHASLVARIAGDLLGRSQLVAIGGIGNVAAIVLFAAVAVGSTVWFSVPARP